MTLPRIIRDFMRSSDDSLVSRAANVSNSMKGNAHFPHPSPALADLDAARLVFSTALADASNVDRLKVRIKNKAREKLQAVLSAQAFYIESVAQGDIVILMSSGFKISKSSAEPPPVNAINGFKVEHGTNSGQMKLSATRVKGVNTYTFFFGIDAGNSTVYDQVTKTRARAVISGLKLGQAYSFYMEAIGSKEKSVKSSPIVKVVS